MNRLAAFARTDLGPGLERAGRFALDLVLPSQCLSCQAAVVEPGHLCGSCWAAIDFLGGSCCSTCGLPFETPKLDGALCGACTRDTPAYSRARAVMRYTDASKGLILRLKHADRYEGRHLWQMAWPRRCRVPFRCGRDYGGPPPSSALAPAPL